MFYTKKKRIKFVYSCHVYTYLFFFFFFYYYQIIDLQRKKAQKNRYKNEHISLCQTDKSLDTFWRVLGILLVYMKISHNKKFFLYTPIGAAIISRKTKQIFNYMIAAGWHITNNDDVFLFLNWQCVYHPLALKLYQHGAVHRSYQRGIERIILFDVSLPCPP